MAITGRRPGLPSYLMYGIVFAPPTVMVLSRVPPSALVAPMTTETTSAPHFSFTSGTGMTSPFLLMFP